MTQTLDDDVTFRVTWGAATHEGQHRAENEDALLARPPIFLVADGMGGHTRGRDASDRVVQAFGASASDVWVTPQHLNEAVTVATELVQELDDGAGGAPGSTVTGVALANHDGLPCWLVFNIGDSRTYRVVDGQLEQITVDHSRRQELIDSGVSLEQARERVAGNVITRAIGGGGRGVPQVDQWLLPAVVGDRLVVCSDGLNDELTDGEICQILQSATDADAAARDLVEAAVTAGGRDNVTVVVVDAVEIGGPASAPNRLEGDTRPDIATGGPDEVPAPHPDFITAVPGARPPQEDADAPRTADLIDRVPSFVADDAPADRSES